MTFTLLEARPCGAASADSARWGDGRYPRTPGRPAAVGATPSGCAQTVPQTALIEPIEMVALGASGRTCSPHSE